MPIQSPVLAGLMLVATLPANPAHSPSFSPLNPDAIAPQALPGLTILMGETWIFHIENGQPAGARRAGPDEKPASGEFKATLDRSGGATMIVTNNSGEWYNYRAFITAKPGHKGNRTSVCTLMPGGRQVFENWPEPFAAIRIADFAEAPDGEMRCQ